MTQIWTHVVNRKRKKAERKKNYWECLFLLGWKTGLRVSESINFDLRLEHPEPQFKNLYLLKGKGKKKRWVYIESEIIEELKNRDWKPKEVNRKGFFDFLQVVKEEMHLAENIELSPHTLRRFFATRNALNGMPLAVLQKILGHEKISTTAIYIKDIDLYNLVKYKPI